jgi:hypothetical protein
MYDLLETVPKKIAFVDPGHRPDRCSTLAQSSIGANVMLSAQGVA